MSAFSSDLVSDTKKHSNFLHCQQNAGVWASSSMPTTTSMSATPAMMDRYLNKLLPLVAALVSATDDDDDEDDYDATTSSLIMIIPPPDVAWLWYCHRLSTHCEVYTKERFGIVIEAHPAFSFQTRDSRMAPSFSSETESHAAAAIKASWERDYSKDSFSLDHAAATTSFDALDNQDLSGHKTLLENFDLTAFCATQAKSLGLFLSPPCFSLDQQHEYLTQAVDEYHTFLQLLTAASTPLVPTFQIDLVWRTHILVSLRQYHKGCIQIQGNRIVYHHTSDIARCAAGAKKLDQAVQTTSDLWQKTYLEPLDDDYWKPPKQMPIVPLQTSTNGSSLSLSCTACASVWEFQQNAGTWKAYGTDEQSILEMAYQTLHATPASCKVQIQGGAWTYEIDFVALKQTNVDHEDHAKRNIQRRNLSNGSFCWEYHGSNNIWEPYIGSYQKKIEDAYASQMCRVTSVQISSGNWTYNVDIQTMVQTNIEHVARAQRQVRRRTDPVKMLAT